jgi:hypothetical protein
MRPTLVEVALLAVLGLARVATTHIIVDTDYVAQAVKRAARSCGMCASKKNSRRATCPAP